MTEYDIQTVLAQYLIYKLNHRFVTPNNTMIFNWESDLISVTGSNLIHEYEIKTNKYDFRNDIKNKKRKHSLLETRNNNYNIPNYFWYVIYNFDINISEIPNYAGLIIIKNNKSYSYPSYIKKAPRLSNRKMNEYQKTKAFESIFYRYWRSRKKLLTEGKK